jgi:hypothetical protein
MVIGLDIYYLYSQTKSKLFKSESLQSTSFASQTFPIIAITIIMIGVAVFSGDKTSLFIAAAQSLMAVFILFNQQNLISRGSAK